MKALAKTDLLILDDWGLATLSDESRRDLLELLEDRYDTRATIVTSQFPVDHWYEAIGDPTLADAILDRLVHNAYKVLDSCVLAIRPTSSGCCPFSLLGKQYGEYLCCGLSPLQKVMCIED